MLSDLIENRFESDSQVTSAHNLHHVIYAAGGQRIPSEYGVGLSANKRKHFMTRVKSLFHT